MRTIAISTTVCGLVLTVANVVSANDFDALLQDLSFGNSPTVTIEQPVASDVDVDKTAATAAPAAQGFVMPSPKTEAIPAAAALTVLDEQTQSPELQRVLQAPTEVAGPNAVEPQPANVNFQEMFTNQDVSESDDALAPIPEPVMTPEPLTNPATMIVSDCGGQCGNHCDNVIECRPHLTPQLPSSTLLQYFRSNKCYSNVWDGYRQHCGYGHDHLHGTCDCFKKGNKSCLGSSCGKCDDCDR